MNRPIVPAARRALAMSGPLLAVLLLSGCYQAHNPQPAAFMPDDYRVNHPITLDDKLHTMDIPVSADTARLTPPVRANIAGFAQRFKSSDSGKLAIVVPKGSPNANAAAAIGRQVRDTLVGAGVPGSRIDFRSYSAGSKEKVAPIRLAYAAITAGVKDCGQWPDRLEQDFQNRNYSNFGCATQANLAAMVDNPLDLLYPRGSEPPDAERRSTTLENYRTSGPPAIDSLRSTSGSSGSN